MGRIGHGYGSEWHLLRYLGRHRDRLDREVSRAVGADGIQWCNFHFASAGKLYDEEWGGLDFVGDKSVTSAWKRFWPQTGTAQNWDALAELHVGGKREWLLVEAKSHLKEIESNCGAKPRGGLGQIRDTMDVVKQALGVPNDAGWLKGYYQFCNRVAALHFLQQAGVPARLLFVYFTGDHFPRGHRRCPHNRTEWARALDAQAKHVGLPRSHPLADRIHKLFLPVGG